MEASISPGPPACVKVQLEAAQALSHRVVKGTSQFCCDVSPGVRGGGGGGSCSFSNLKWLDTGQCCPKSGCRGRQHLVLSCILAFEVCISCEISVHKIFFVEVVRAPLLGEGVGDEGGMICRGSPTYRF